MGELLKTITTGKSVNSDDGAVAVGDIGILKTSCVSYDRFNPYESKPVVKDELQSVKCAVEKDSVIVSRMNTPERVGACGYVSTDFPNLFLPDRLWKLKFQDNVDAYFVYMMLVSSVYKEKITSMASGTSGSMYNIPKETFLNLQLVVPVQTSEQRKIGQVLRQLNDLITLHQRKYDKLQVLKKAMLEKMFPKNGSSVPEIRFKGFTDAWEQRKLSEIAGKVTEKNTGLQYVETLTNSAEFGIISQRDFFDHDISKLGSLDGYYIVRNEDFVYNPRISTSAPVGPINRNKLGRTGVMSPLYTVFRPHDIDTTYLEHFFKCGYWYSFMNFNGDSGARSDRFSIKDDVFFQMPIPIPDIDEQRKIGELLTCLDNLITLHQRELEKLQNIKKSMLEKMFV